MTRRAHVLGVLAGVLAWTVVAQTAEKSPRAGGAGKVRLPTGIFRTEVPAHDFDLILVRPAREEMSLSLLAYRDLRGVVRIGRKPEALDQQAVPVELRAGRPALVTFGRLQPATRYYFRFEPLADTGVAAGEVGSFTTARAPGTEFSFTLQADSHLDAGTDLALYERSLKRVEAAQPDFHLDLGDTFMNDKRADFHEARANYLAQRHYFSRVGGTVPVLWVLGNHDGEQGGWRSDSAEGMPVWSNTMRKTYFPNPLPDGFYRGNLAPHPVAGLLGDFYAWEWGDALFIVLDPFWYSDRVGRNDSIWSRTLGRGQYEWLREVLARSRARFKFVFLHHLVGGVGPEGRGGDLAVPGYEWGGHESDGRDTFARHRPGWEMPIHPLLVKHRVTAVFHGHDHLFAEQEVDGIVYQALPQPGHPRPNARQAAEYGYAGGTIFGASGVMRVRVSPAEVTLDFLPADSDSDVVAHRRVIPWSGPQPGPR